MSKSDLLISLSSMQIIPAVNETSFDEVKKKIQRAQEFGALWVHLDVADGKFTPNRLWNNPKDLITNYQLPITNFNIEVHLMVENPDEVISEWLEAGVKRVIVHVEVVRDVKKLKEICDKMGAELMLAAKPDTSVKQLSDHDYIKNFLILAVDPGISGQTFKEDQLEKIKTLRVKRPDATIEVDGGVNTETASAIKAAGADILVSASYIWKSENPKEVYQSLATL